LIPIIAIGGHVVLRRAVQTTDVGPKLTLGTIIARSASAGTKPATRAFDQKLVAEMRDLEVGFDPKRGRFSHGRMLRFNPLKTKAASFVFADG
jgi:hypothetical protein